MDYQLGDTIAAVATPSGEGGIGVIRVSGPDAPAVAARVVRNATGTAIDLSKRSSHRLVHGYLIDPADDRRIDEVVVAWFRAPHSYTREHTVEISCHGGATVVRETLRVVLAAGARLAGPGEFTLRAFLSGRIDLSQAEAVLDVVRARTSSALSAAHDALGGGLARRMQPARAAVIGLLVFLDASADFPEDEIPPSDVDADLAAASAALAEVLAGARTGMLLREGAQVALAGRPNAGKSSLLNALLRADRAIVTPIAGTTRDVIAETVSISGIAVTLLDTAGIGDTEDAVERLGIERSHRAMEGAAAIVLVLDGAVRPVAADLAVAGMLARRDLPVVIAQSKSDLGAVDQSPVTALLPGRPVIAVSSVTGEGLPEIEAAIVRAIGGADAATPSLLTARQQAALERAHLHVAAAAAARREGYPLDLLATDIRAAAHAIGEVTGESIDDAVLAEIFSRFCIGK